MAADKEENGPRKYTLTVNVTVRNVTAEQAQAIEDAIRDVADEYDEDVFATKSNYTPL